MTFEFSLIAGLDPAIQKAAPQFMRGRLDARVKPGHEGAYWFGLGARELAR
jgi:hypothetical protein